MFDGSDACVGPVTAYADAPDHPHLQGPRHLRRARRRRAARAGAALLAHRGDPARRRLRRGGRGARGLGSRRTPTGSLAAWSLDSARPPEVDTIIVGAGLSGIGAAARLGQEHPDHDYLVLEGRAASGGTWDLFRYPGIRSDSDMYTLGYRFKPWTRGEGAGRRPAILDYVRETAREYDVERRIRYSHRVVAADWDSASARWTVTAETPDGVRRLFESRFLWSTTGYYDYDEPYAAVIPGLDDFAGRSSTRSTGPADLDVTGQRVRGDRLRRDRRHPGAGAGRRRARPTSRCCSARRRTCCRCRRSTRWRRACGAGCRRRRPTAPSGGRTSRSRWRRTRSPPPSRRRAPLRPQGQRGRAARGLPGRPRLQAGLRRLGPAALPGARRRPVPGDPQAARAEVVTDTITGFTADGVELASGADARRRRRGDGDRPAGAALRRHRPSPSTVTRSSCRRRWPIAR